MQGRVRTHTAILGMSMSQRSSTMHWQNRAHALRFALCLLGIGALLGGCAAQPVNRGSTAGTQAAPSSDAGFTVLAGEWEYEEGTAAVDLVMDQAGRGTYAYKGGRFETTSLIGQEWRGRWIQTENDREGEFVIRLSPDYREGDGRWWYTRIGSVRNPSDKGGTFHLTRTDDAGDPQPRAASY